MVAVLFQKKDPMETTCMLYHSEGPAENMRLIPLILKGPKARILHMLSLVWETGTTSNPGLLKANPKHSPTAGQY